MKPSKKTAPFAYDDAVDLLDADHKAVKKMFIDYSSLCDDDAPEELRSALAEKICKSLLVHMQIEEEIFYPAVRKAINDSNLVGEAVDEHAAAKKAIKKIQSASADDKRDTGIKNLAHLIDEHVLEEREQIFLRSRYSTLDLKSLAVTLHARKAELQASAK